MRGDPARRGLAGQFDGVVLRGGEVLRGVLIAGHRRPPLGQEVEDQVAPLDDRRVIGNLEGGVRTLGVLLDLGRAGLLGVAHEVVVGGRLGQRGDDRGLGRGDVLELDAEVGPDGRFHAVALVAVVVLVEVGGDDLLLALDTLELLGDPDRLDDLLELSLDRPLRVLDEVLLEQACCGRAAG